PRTFEQQVIEAERQVERRVAVPRALGVEEYRAVRTDKDVLRADVAVYQGELGVRGGLGEAAQRARAVRVTLRGREQVRLGGDGVEDVVVRKAPGDVAPPGGGGVHERDAAPDLGGERGIDAAVAELRLPHRVRLGREPRHREEARRAILADQL